MEFQTVTYRRVARFKVNGNAARELRNSGLSLKQIRDKLGVDASLAAVSRAIKHATEAASESGTGR